MTKITAIDQYGQCEHGLDAKHPRKALLDRLGAKSAHKIYVDKKDGTSVQIGYAVGNRWFSLYKVERWEKPLQ